MTGVYILLQLQEARDLRDTVYLGTSSKRDSLVFVPSM